MPFSVFISYAHRDQAFCQELETHLSNLRRQNVIASWYDGDISPGSEWKSQIIDGFAYAFYDIFKGIVMRGPPGDSLAACRQDLEFGEGRSLPVGGTQDNGDNTCLVGIMPCDRLRHLQTVTEIGGHEVSADQQ